MCSLRSPPAHLIYVDGFLEALQRNLAGVGEEEAFARAQLSHGERGQCLAALGLGCNTRRQDDARDERAVRWAAFFGALILSPLPGSRLYCALVRGGCHHPTRQRWGHPL